MNPLAPRLEVYYRVSERSPWNLLGIITSDTIIENVDKRIDQTLDEPIRSQRYQITKILDGVDVSSLPEFNEIQYWFKSYNGFSVIGATHEYSYITRNVKR